MKTKDSRQTPRRRTAAGGRSREAVRLEKLYRELGFVYAGSNTQRSTEEIDFGLDRMDTRPRINLTFSALSAQ